MNIPLSNSHESLKNYNHGHPLRINYKSILVCRY